MKTLQESGQKALGLDDLRPADYNPRKIHPKAEKGLAYSMETFGDISGITWNKRTGNLVCGHQRVNQGRKAGAMVTDNVLVMPNGERFPIRIVDWPIAKERAANVAANNPGISGEFDESLNAVVEQIKLEMPQEEFEKLCFYDAVTNPEVESKPKNKSELSDIVDLEPQVVCALPYRYDIGHGICPVGCLYCFVRSTPALLRSTNITIVNPKSIEKKFLEVHKKNGLFVTGLCIEPTLMPLRENLKLIFQLSKKHKTPVMVRSKRPSELLGMDIDWSLLSVIVSMSFPDECVSKEVEPNADLLSVRLKSMMELQRLGASTVLGIQPLILDFANEYTESIRVSGCERVICEPLRISASGIHYFDKISPFIAGGIKGYFERWGTGKTIGPLHWYVYDDNKLHDVYMRLRGEANAQAKMFGICSNSNGCKHVHLNQGDYCCQVLSHGEAEVDEYSISRLAASGNLGKFIVPELRTFKAQSFYNWELLLNRIGWINHADTAPKENANG